MSLRRLLTRTVTVIRRTSSGPVDRYGNPTEFEDAGVDYPGRIEYDPAGEDIIDRNEQVEAAVVYLPPEAAIDGTDRVVSDGETWEVIGPPDREWSFGRLHHVRARLRKVIG